MADWEDYYDILGVNPDSGDDEIRDAYLYKVNILHPDRLMGAPESVRRRAEDDLKKVNRAYAVLKDHSKREQYHLEWVEHSIQTQRPSVTPKPKPEIDPSYIYFTNAEIGQIQRSSFTVRNVGGPYNRVWISNPDSWVRVVRFESVTPFDELPLVVEIEAVGDEWGKSYSEYIRVRLDEEEAQVRIELQTTAAPPKGNVRLDTADQSAKPIGPTFSVRPDRNRKILRLHLALLFMLIPVVIGFLFLVDVSSGGLRFMLWAVLSTGPCFVIADRIWSIGKNEPGKEIYWGWLLLSLLNGGIGPICSVIAIVVYIRGLITIFTNHNPSS